MYYRLKASLGTFFTRGGKMKTHKQIEQELELKYKKVQFFETYNMVPYPGILRENIGS